MVKLRYNVGIAVDKFCEYMKDSQKGKFVIEERCFWLEIIDAYYGLRKLFPRVCIELRLPHASIDNKKYLQIILRNDFVGEKREEVLEHTLRHMAHTMMAMFRVTFMASVCLRDLATVFRRQPQLNQEEEREGGSSWTITLGNLKRDIERFDNLIEVAGHILVARPQRTLVRYDSTDLFHGEKFRWMLDDVTRQLEANYGGNLGSSRPIDLLDQNYIDRRCENMAKDRS
ncbi:hypothetical protein PG996_015493 [Apiospora saccharicola]|uniref:Uncharacterized protein n=1 Tax=Apiospora saccharicola TaxID=335842 RepID=A0ABR1TLB4_9PEZI